MSKSKWAKLELYPKVRAILDNVSYDHHFGERPFIISYQLAIEFHLRYRDTSDALGYPIGGPGTGDGMTLAKYLSNILSRKIKDGSICDIEGAFLGNLHLNDVRFNTPTGPISSTLTQSQYPASMFRLRDGNRRSTNATPS